MLTQTISKKQGKLAVKLIVAIFKEDKYFVTYCPALELSAYSTTIEKTTKEFVKEVDIFFKETTRKGTLEKLLIRYGWTLRMGKFEPPAPSVATLNEIKDFPGFRLQEEKINIPYSISA